MQDSFVIVASYLVIGLTEEDIYYLRSHLEKYAVMFLEDENDKNIYLIEVVADSIYPALSLKIEASAWERFARSHDMVEFSLVMSQNNILGELH